MRSGWTKLFPLYNGQVPDIDLYAGMLMERPVKGAQFGPTILSANVEQVWLLNPETLKSHMSQMICVTKRV